MPNIPKQSQTAGLAKESIQNLPPELTFLTDAQAAEFTGKSRQSLANDRVKGRGFPYSRFGRSIRYRLSDILAAAEASRVVPGRTPAHPEPKGEAVNAQ
jgi:hypothetical protein